MKLVNLYFMLFVLFLYSMKTSAQGPPITADKPIMLSSGTWVIKTLTEIRQTEKGTFTKAPLMVHYLPTSSALLGAYIPLVEYENKRELGGVQLIGKYQFYRKDLTGKTFRVVAKTLQTLPTGKSLDFMEGLNENYQGYFGLVAGYETIKYGISNEVGYNWNPVAGMNDLRYKLGFGLPLLKPSYPVDQINLYFEYQNNWFISTNDYLLLYAQGIQYAKGKMTFEMAIQFPLIQTLAEDRRFRHSFFLGARYIL